MLQLLPKMPHIISNPFIMKKNRPNKSDTIKLKESWKKSTKKLDKIPVSYAPCNSGILLEPTKMCLWQSISTNINGNTAQAFLVRSRLASSWRKDDTNNKTIKRKSFSKDKDQDHTHKKLRLLSICPAIWRNIWLL